MKRRKGQTGRDIVVIGTSAGGVETLLKLFKDLPADIRAAFFVVIHVQPNAPSYMPAMLSRASRLSAEHAQDKRRIEAGKIYVAPPDHHILIEQGRMRLSHGPKENRHRPAIDPLFRTAAETYNSRVIGIVLTGTLDDGTMGLRAVKDAGGVTIVQDPGEALYPGMPRNAIQIVEPDYVLRLREIRMMLPRLIQEPVKEKVMKRFKDKGMKPEDRKIKSGLKINEDMGPPSMFVCPECNGPLWEMRNGKATLFRCMVGHSFAPENLYAAQTEEVERALWTALRALEERVALQQTLAERADSQNRDRSSRHFRNNARENSKHAEVIRKILENLNHA
jgi:two-component system, chemotaxis family, protein-glutamate methylesterase/glutaminase